jgi:serine protease Do
MSTKGKVSIAVFVGGAFLAGILFATAGANLFGLGNAVGTAGQAATLDGSTALEQEASTSAPQDFQMAFTKVAESVNPAVVQIRAEKVVERRMRSPFEGTPFEDFFGGPGGPEREFRSQGLGSGVFIQSDGHLVTNNHVVEGADELSVVTINQTQYDAEIVGTDPTRDLAVLKVDSDEDFRAISFGDSDALQTGQWVLAFGSPLSQNLNNSVSAGIVSAMGRLQSAPQRRQRQPAQQEQQISPVMNFVQTDAAINPGNSGGPLVNLSGELVGINTAIASQTGGYQGIGFSIPSNTVERIATQIIETGEVRRGRLGVQYGPASQSLVQNESLPSGSAVIRSVEDGSAADEAGLEPGDVVTAVNGEPLQNHLQLGNQVASRQPGDEVTLTVNRDGEDQEINVTLGSAGSETQTADAQGEEAPSPDQLMEELGLSIRNITPEIARQLGMDDTDGVIITEVDRSNRSIRESGLQEKLIIVEIAGQPVPDVETFRAVYGEIEPGNAFRVVVRSPQGFVNVTSLRKPANGG